MTVYTFRLRRIIGEQPDSIPKYATTFRASRPIFGTPVDLGLMGFQTFIEPNDEYRSERLPLNLNLDAEVIEWVSEQDALKLAYDYVAADYDEATAAEAGSDVLLDMWQQLFGMDKVKLVAW